MSAQVQETDRAYFLKLARMRMPFGKYANRLLIDLPESYVIWFKQKGFPSGDLGNMLQIVYEIKVNGLEHLFDPFREK
jgi:uncharacterized protein (DUF3820 family)